MSGLSLLKNNRTYRNLFLGNIGSQLGDWFNQVALAQVTLALTHSESAMGAVLMCRSLPGVLLGPILGPYADKLPKKTVLVTTDLLRAVLALGYGIAVLLNLSYLLYVSSLLMGLSSILFGPVRQSVIPHIVSEGELTTANALSTGAAGVVQMIGATTGGIVASSVHPVVCFAINAVSYLWSALCVLQCHWRERNSERHERISYREALHVGLREAWTNRVVKCIILIGIGWGLAGGGYYVLIPVLGSQTGNLHGLGIGVLYTIDGFGVLVGAMMVQRFVRGSRMRATVWYGWAYITQAIFFTLMAQTQVFWVIGMLLFGMRLSSGVIIPLDSYLFQAHAKPEVIARVFTLHASTYGGVMQVSYVFTGFLFEHAGIHLTAFMVGSISLICGVAWLSQFGWKRTQSPPVSIS